jgi:hypothetical protein
MDSEIRFEVSLTEVCDSASADHGEVRADVEFTGLQRIRETKSG